MKKWLIFEKLSTEIQRDLASDAVVKHNDKIRGKITKRLRQVDISIRKKIGQFEMLIVIDCKDYKRKVDVKAVGGVMELAEDVGANKTAIIAANGFTKSAIARAQAAGVELLTLVDTREHDWRKFAAIPVVFEFIMLRSYSFEFEMIGRDVLLYPKDERELLIYDKNGILKCSLGEFVNNLWMNFNNIDSYVLGSPIPLSTEQLYFKTDAGISHVQISVCLDFERNFYAGKLPLKEVSGFKNEISGILNHTGIRTAGFNIYEIMAKWKKYPSLIDVPFKPVLKMQFR
ncbi:MAG: restriction endonuclease [Desulfosarcina sp.]|nr:restriction endonuclease [Desulfobacterales bacterium]